MYRNVSLKMDKIFPKYYITYFGLCKFFNNGYLFSYDAVFLGHPVVMIAICVMLNFVDNSV